MKSVVKALLLDLLGTTQQTSPSGSDETSLLTLGGVTRDGGGFTDMLVVTTTVGVVHGVHGHTTSLGPAVALDGELVLGTRSLQHGLVCSATTSDNTDHSTGGGVNDLLGTGGQLDAGLALIGVVADDGDVVSGGTAQSATVTNLLLDVGNDGTLGHGAERQDVTDGQGGVLSGVDELASVHALVGDEGVGGQLELVGVAEDDLGQRSATAGVVDDLLDDTTNVSVSLGVVEGPELGWGLVQAGNRLEDRRRTLSLVPDNSSHLGCWLEASRAVDDGRD